MKKNKMMRLASCLLVAVMLTTSVISGTFAKYVTTHSADDTARVAKWGVTVAVTGEEAFSKTYKDAHEENESLQTVVSSNKDKVLAPGTNGTLATVAITGTPEVDVEIEVVADVVLTGWQVNGNVYCPLVFNVGGTELKIDTTNTDADKLATAVENAIVKALEQKTVQANAGVADNLTVTWNWPFEVEGNNALDTTLGDLAANNQAPTISCAVTVTVTQIN